MTRCVVQLNDGSYLNIKADRMGKHDDFLWIFDGDKLVAVADLGAVVTAHLSTKGGVENDG